MEASDSAHHGAVNGSLLRPARGDLPLTSPAALRVRRAGWRDPRLVVGLALVALSVLVGVRVMAGAEATVPVLAARGPLAAGQRVGADDLVPVQVRFTSEADADRYLPGEAGAAAPLPAGAVLLRPVGAGELVPRSAVATAGGDGLVELPLTVDAGRVPAAVRAGSTVDVWVSSASRDKGRSSTELLLEAVPVLDVSAGGAQPGALRQVVVGVGTTDQGRLDEVVGLAADESLVLVRRSG